MSGPSCLVHGAGPRATALVRMILASGVRDLQWAGWQEAAAPPGAASVSLEDGLARHRLVFLAVPAEELAAVAEGLSGVVTGAHLLIHWCPHMAGGGSLLPSQLLRSRVATHRIGALGGPLALEEQASGVPQGAVLASPFPEVIECGRACLAGPALRVYGSRDLVGVELASLLLTVASLADGLVEGLSLGPSARALVATRALAELRRLGVAAGASPDTFSGLAGVGSILHAAVGPSTPAVELGRALATASRPSSTVGERAAWEELQSALASLCSLADTLRVDVPLSQGLLALLHGDLDARALGAGLMARTSRDEQE